MKPFRFGVAIDATTREELIARARQAEDFGYSTLHAFDHIGSVMAPFTSLAIAAEATKTIRLGSLVFGNDFRHPAMLAWEAATLDVLSGGRLELGLGTGYWKADYEQTGEADIVSVNIKTTPDGGFDMHSLSAESAIEKVGWVRELLGERFSQTELNALIIVVEITDNRLAFAQKIHDEWFGALSPQQILESPSCLIGSVDQIVDDMMMRRERYGFSYISIFGEHMQKFAPVVARLSGT